MSVVCCVFINPMTSLSLALLTTHLVFQTVVFRTWDTSTKALHSNATYYQEVTRRVAPHPKLVFSIKHTALDFWRRTNWNPCIGVGRHQQVVEMCIGNVFQGMGAYPSYVPSGVINGFPEVAPLYGLADAVRDFPDIVVGVFPVTQGSFSFEYSSSKPPCEDCYGGVVPQPFVWPTLEFKVMAAWGNDPSRSEEDIFYGVVKREWGLAAVDAAVFRKALLLAMDANLHMETVGVFDDAVTQGVIRPSAQFMNRNSLAGLAVMGLNGSCNAGPGVPGSGVDNACEVIPWLHDHSQEEAAIADKQLATALYSQVASMFSSVRTLPPTIKRHVSVTTQYGELLANLVYQGFISILEGTKRRPNVTRLCAAAGNYNVTKQHYTDLWDNHPGVCPTLFTDETWWYGEKPPGLGVDVRRFQGLLC